MLYNFFLNIQDGKSWWRFFKSIWVIVLISILYIPWIFIVIYSFFTPTTKGNIPLSFSGTFDYGKNYENFFSNSSYYGNFWTGLMNSLLIAGITIPISLFIGIFSVIAIWNNQGKYKKSTFAFSNTSIATPDVVQAISFFALFLIFLVPLGINFGMFTTILSHIAISVPYVIVFLYPKISKINIKILYASYDLKYGKCETIFSVLIPTMLPNIIAASLLIFSLSFDDFIITNLVRGNVITLPSEMYTMKRGIKGWVITFGAILFWISCFIVIIHTFFSLFSEKKTKHV